MNEYPKAIFFDLDDTLISFDGVSAGAWDESCKDFVKKHECPYSKEELLATINRARKWYWSDERRQKEGRENLKQARRDIVRAALSEYGIKDDEIIRDLADGYTALQYSRVHAYPNTIATLNSLKKDGVRMSLITNGPSDGQREKLRRFGLTDYFEHLLIDQELGFSKPDVRVYYHALGLMNLTASEVWMVGDNLVWDVGAPKSIGIYSIWHDRRGEGVPKNSAIIPDRIITDISQLVIGSDT